MNAKVSVVLPSLNVADYIEECLASVLNQSLDELEVICVDAGSTDGTREILDDYAKKDSRIVVLHSNVKSYGKQVNMGLDYACGAYVAILETDDWVEPDMYRCLYEHGAADGLDYVAADFDLFYQLQSGEYYYIRQKLFHAGNAGWYGQLLGPSQLATLRACDYALWKGIYDRNFLNTNHIRLHESAGAAFQDMGFLQQAKTYAKKAKYLDQSFYRYRQDRGDASSASSMGLQYYKEEFLWMDQELQLNHMLKGVHRKYYYLTMSISFITKYEQVLVRLGGDWKDKRLGIPYGWFRGQVSMAIEEGLIDESMYEKGQWGRLMLLLASQRLFAQFAMEKEREKRGRAQNLLDLTGGRPVVIFGCGVRGEGLMHFCNCNHIQVYGFCDNNTAFFGRKKYGYPILSPAELAHIAKEENKAVVLSMKNGKEEVYSQLAALGMEPGRIVKHLPEGVL